jgi:hypothetical protein
MGYDFELLDAEDNGDGTRGRIKTRIHCSACKNDCVLTAGNGGLSVEWARRRFKNKGWALGKSRDLDLCPQCMKGVGGAKGARVKHALERGVNALMNGTSPQAAAAMVGRHNMGDVSLGQLQAIVNTLDFDKLNKKATPTEKKEMTNVVAMIVEEPKKMGRDEKRLVFEKLNEHYVSETVGYADGFSDKRIAEELGCPRKWVEDVREEMFGPVRINNEAKNFVGRIAALDQKIFEVKAQFTVAQQAYTDISKAMEVASNAYKSVLGEFDALKRLAKQLEKLY